MKFSEMVTGSILARFMAILILSLVMICAIIVAFYDLMINRSVPSSVCTILGIGLGTAGTLVGINFGVVLQPATPAGPTQQNSTTITTTTAGTP